MQVNFLVCGAQKSGTTALDHALRQHPNICMSTPKETHFFDDDAQFEPQSKTNQPDYTHYHAHFKPAPSQTLLGESTPIYMYWNNCIQRIHTYNPAMKLIIILRNPIERAYSHWNMETARGNESEPFLDAIKREQDQRIGQDTNQSRITSYLDRGNYAKQLNRIWSIFPKHQTHILKTESLRDHPSQTMSSIFTFLDLPNAPIQTDHLFAHPYPEPMTKEIFAHLADHFTPSIQHLESLLNWDCSQWYTKAGTTNTP